MVQNGTKNEQKTSNFFECKICDYNTIKRTNYNRHILSAKHKMVQNGTKNEQKRAQNIMQSFRCKCGKEYKHKSHLYRHKSTCNFKEEYNNSIISNKVIENKDKMINKLIDENRDLTNKIVELAKEPKTVNNNTTNNTTNNMTINVFLNEKCKDAMNLIDFVKNLNITWDDTAQTKDICIEQSLTNLIMDRVKDMDITKRPIHCTDKKRLQYYVKDGEWKNKDIDIVFDKVLYDISNRHRQNLIDYCDEYPEWMKADENTAMYFGISEGTLLFKNEMPNRINKVKKLLSSQVLLKKEDYC